jgi:CheY-like chemotaxis protein
MNEPLAGRRPAEILLVEDNQGDVVLARESFKRVGMAINLHQVDNGEQCLAFLRKEGGYAGAPTPDIVLLDLNMPGMDGREALAHIVADPALRYLPVVILTTAANAEDVRQMYQLRCSSYIVKPLTFVEFQQTMKTFCDYWFNTVVLPSPA